MPIHTAYVRHRETLPDTVNNAVSILGFDELGIEVRPFYGFGDIEAEVDCGPQALVHGFIGDVYKAMDKLGLPRPPSIDYPEELTDFYGRKIWTGTLDDIQDKGLHEGVFVKPQEQKLFTGLLWKGTPQHRLHLAPYDKTTPTYFSEPVQFLSEYRCYVLEGEILGVRFYKGDWSVAPCRRVVETAVGTYAPYRAYAIDVGVLVSGETVVVEVNDAFALGCYGLHHVAYARMIEARWEELTESLV